MRVLGIIVGWLLILAAFGLLGITAWYSLEIAGAVIEGAQELEPTVYVPLVVTVLTASLGLGATLYTQWVSRKREIEAAHRERKLEIYLEFMQMLEGIIASSKEGWGEPKKPENKLARELLALRSKAVLWGSPRVLKALAELARPNKTTKEMFLNMDEIQRAMRRDLGLSNFGLDTNFFVKIALNDPAELDKLK